MRVLIASLLLVGCHRDLDVPECAYAATGCADTAVAEDTASDSLADAGEDSAAADAPADAADACECSPGEIAPVTGTCPGVLEKKTKTCTTSCTWGEETCALPKGWTAIADPPTGFAGRYQSSTIWTGGELIVFGGSESETGTPKTDGAIYRPYKNTWELLPDSSLITTGRARHASAWTGDAMIIYGGFSGGGFLADALAYEPFFKRWEKLPDAPLAARDAAAAVWAPTVKRFIVWGGRGATDLADGAEYDPSARTWTKLPAAPIAGRGAHSAVWTGSELAIFGGQSLSGPLYDGALYNPTTRTWRSLPAMTPKLRGAAMGMTSAGSLIAFGGLDATDKPSAEGAIASLGATPAWSLIPKPSTDLFGARLSPAVWIHDTELLAWSGAVASGSTLKFETSGAALNVTTATWMPISNVGAPTGRVFATAVWMGTCGLVWSGVGAPGGGVTEVLRDGAIYCP